MEEQNKKLRAESLLLRSQMRDAISASEAARQRVKRAESKSEREAEQRELI